MSKLDTVAWDFTSTEIIAEEARRIDGAFGGRDIPQDGARGGRDLRLHVAGDVQTAEEAQLLAGAARRWRQRGGGTVWTFTHAWRDVPREAWGEAITVLASVEHPGDVLRARRQGYPAALVVSRFTMEVRHRVSRVELLPCPAETRGKDCISCRLCLDRDLLKMGITIGFEIHGQQAHVAARQLG